MDAEDILNHYVYRWPIEVFFRESKRYLGLGDYQVRTEKATKGFFILLMLTYVYCGLEVSGETLNFSKGFKVARKEVEQSQVAWIYKQLCLESLISAFSDLESCIGIVYS